jgi:hypothetical protein
MKLLQSLQSSHFSQLLNEIYVGEKGNQSIPWYLKYGTANTVTNDCIKTDKAKKNEFHKNIILWSQAVAYDIHIIIQ